MKLSRTTAELLARLQDQECRGVFLLNGTLSSGYWPHGSNINATILRSLLRKNWIEKREEVHGSLHTVKVWSIGITAAGRASLERD